MRKEKVISLIEEQCGSDFVFGKVAAYKYVKDKMTLSKWTLMISKDENLPGLHTVVFDLFDEYGIDIDKVFD